jgi:hypothetical protein
VTNHVVALGAITGVVSSGCQVVQLSPTSVRVSWNLGDNMSFQLGFTNPNPGPGTVESLGLLSAANGVAFQSQTDYLSQSFSTGAPGPQNLGDLDTIRRLTNNGGMLVITPASTSISTFAATGPPNPGVFGNIGSLPSGTSPALGPSDSYVILVSGTDCPNSQMRFEVTTALPNQEGSIVVFAKRASRGRGAYLLRSLLNKKT